MNNLPPLDDLKLFATVVRCGSFVATALELGSSPSYVSKRVALLERSLGTRLLHRTTRRISLTEDGETIYAWSKRILEDVQQMQQDVARTHGEPQGVLKVSSSFRLGRNHVAPAISALVRRYPKLEVSLTVLDRPVDLLAEGFDVDIRIGEVPEPHLIAHRITPSHRVLCAAPAYLARRGTPLTLAELSSHSCLVFRERDQPFGTWRLQGPKGLETVKVTGTLSSNNNDIIRQWALDGWGIARLSAWDCEESLNRGELVHVLPAYRWPADVWAVTPGRLAQSAKMRACVRFLQEQLTRGPYALFPPGSTLKPRGRSTP